MSEAKNSETKPNIRLREVVLLGGAVRASQLVGATRRSMLDMPLTETVSVMDHWTEQVEELAQSLDHDSLSLRVLVSDTTPPPTSHHERACVNLKVEQDVASYRGTAGVLRDTTHRYDENDWMLVATAGQVLVEPLMETYQALASVGGEVNIISHADGLPVGLMLIRIGVLAEVSELGYQDFKEQVLPQIAEHHDVRVIKMDRHVSVPIRTQNDYLSALRHWHRLASGKREPGVFDEDWRTTFSLIEHGGQVSEKARIHDSVVLSGGVVESDAIVVRSIVCPNAIVHSGQRVTDEIYAGSRATGRSA